MMDFDEVTPSLAVGLFEIESATLTNEREPTILVAFYLLLSVAWFSFVGAVDPCSWVTFAFELVIAFKVWDWRCIC